jgi:hypothetical protein
MPNFELQSSNPGVVNFFLWGYAKEFTYIFPFFLLILNNQVRQQTLFITFSQIKFLEINFYNYKFAIFLRTFSGKDNDCGSYLN